MNKYKSPCPAQQGGLWSNRNARLEHCEMFPPKPAAGDQQAAKVVSNLRIQEHKQSIYFTLPALRTRLCFFPYFFTI